MRAKMRRHSEFLLILVLFVSFRLMMLVAFSPGGFLTNYTDHFYYYSVAELSESGYYPLVNYWSEYPPLSAYLSLAVYILAKAIHPGFLHYTLTLAVSMLVFESANLILLYCVARTLWERSISLRICWIYSCLLIPLFFWWGSLELLVVFFSLLTVYLFLVNRYHLSAIALGLGILAKYTPLLLLAPVFRLLLGHSAKVKYLLIAAVTVMLGFLPFLILAPQHVVASFRVLAGLPPWQTVWAVLEGDFGTGGLGSIDVLFDLGATPRGTASSYLPAWALATLLLGLFCLYVLVRKRVQIGHNRSMVVLSAMMFCVFFLWSKGWSPDWLVVLIPFILLVFPDWRGVLYCLTLSFNDLLEWPIFFVGAPDRPEVFVLIVIVRALVVVLLLANLYQELGKEASLAQHY
jgi:uncharacterized membrane protein